MHSNKGCDQRIARERGLATCHPVAMWGSSNTCSACGALSDSPQGRTNLKITKSISFCISSSACKLLPSLASVGDTYKGREYERGRKQKVFSRERGQSGKRESKNE